MYEKSKGMLKNLELSQIKHCKHYFLAHSCMRALAQAMNEYRGGEMSTEVLVNRNCERKLWPVNGSENTCERGSMVELLTFVCTDLVRGQY